MNGAPDGYRLERLKRAKGSRFVYRFVKKDSDEPDHRLCAPCWNGDSRTMVLHENPTAVDHSTILTCPRCKWKCTLER